MAHIKVRLALDHDDVGTLHRLAGRKRTGFVGTRERVERRGTQTIEQISHEHRKKAVALLIGYRIKRQRQAGCKPSAQ